MFNIARYHYENSAQNIQVARCDYCLGRVLLSQARYDESEKILKKSLTICIILLSAIKNPYLTPRRSTREGTRRYRHSTSINETRSAIFGPKQIRGS